MFSWLKSSKNSAGGKAPADAVGLAVNTLLETGKHKADARYNVDKLGLDELLKVLTGNWVDAVKVPDLLDQRSWRLAQEKFGIELIKRRVELFDSRSKGKYGHRSQSPEFVETKRRRVFDHFETTFSIESDEKKIKDFDLKEFVKIWQHPSVDGVLICLKNSSSYNNTGRNSTLIVLMSIENQSLFSEFLSASKVCERYRFGNRQNYFHEQTDGSSDDVFVTAYQDWSYRDYSQNFLSAHFANCFEMQADEDQQGSMPLSAAAGFAVFDSISSSM